MLPLQYRLKKRKSFNYIYRHGKSFGCACLTLVYIYVKPTAAKTAAQDTNLNSKTTPAKNLKIGFSASKKVGNSVMRHRAVRKMREALRPLTVSIAPNHNCIFIAKDTILTKSVADIQTACTEVLKKAGLITAAAKQ